MVTHPGLLNKYAQKTNRLSHELLYEVLPKISSFAPYPSPPVTEAVPLAAPQLPSISIIIDERTRNSKPTDTIIEYK
jgi:hypothetical protein